MSKSILSIFVILSLAIGIMALEVPQIRYVSSSRGKGLVLNNIPNDVKMSVKKNGDIILLTFVSPSFAQAAAVTYTSQSLKNDEISNIAARMTNGHLEVVFSTTQASLFSAVSFKPVAGQKKGMVLLSSKASANNEVILVAKTTAPLAKTTAPVAKTTAPLAKTTAPLAKTTAPLAKTTAPLAKTTAPLAKTTAPVAKTTAPVAKTTAPVAKTTAPVAKTNASAKKAKVLFLVQDEVNIRMTPQSGSSSNIVGKYPIGSRFESVEQSGSFYKVTLKDGKAGWVHMSVAKDSALISPAIWDVIHNSKKSAKTYAVATPKSTKSTQSTDAFSLESTGRKSTPDALKPSVVKGATTDTLIVTKGQQSKYTPMGRDPFIPLEKAGDLYKEDELPRLESIELAGVLYDASNAIALFEEKQQNGPSVSFTLMKGDLIKNGKVHQIFPEKVVFLMQEYNYTYTVEKILRRQKK